MGNFCGFEAQHPEGAHIVEYKKRHCTDFILLLSFLAIWLGSIYVISDTAAAGGDPYKIVYPVDTYGRICGIDEGVEDLKYGVWPFPNHPDIKFCASSCNETSSNTMDLMPATYGSKQYTRYCIPDDAADFGNSTIDNLFGEGTASTISRAVADLYTVWWAFLISIFIAILLSFIYAKGLKIFGSTMVYGGFAAIALAGVLSGMALWAEAEEQRDGNYSEYADVMEYSGYVVMGFSVLFALIVCCLRNKIKLAIEIVKEAGEALVDMPALIFFPLVPVFLGAAYMVYWIIVSLYIFSVTNTETFTWPSDVKTAYQTLSFGNWNPTGLPANETNWADRTTYEDEVFDNGYQNYFYFHFFHLLWQVQFLIYFNYLVVSSAIARWYFTHPNERKDLSHNKPVRHSVKQTIRYHLGSIATGSLIIAIIQMIRVIVKYIEETTKPRHGERNKVQKAVFCAIHCCLWCLECCLDKISKYAYCWTAIWGDSFFPAACNSFKLLYHNLARAAVVTVVGSYLLLIGKVVVALGTTGIVGFIIYGTSSSDINSLLLPAIVIFIIAFLVCHLFMVEFDTTIDTIFMCFLVDEKFNAGKHEMFASEKIQKILHIDSHHFEESNKKHGKGKGHGKDDDSLSDSDGEK
jgi:hypothetical protein